MTLFSDAVLKKNLSRPPVWFMRQAGRYHAHYQELKTRYTFMDLCKRPELACETTMGPIRDFDFDAAILFSDLLFPLEAMGMGLEYNPKPELGWHLRSPNDLAKLESGAYLAREKIGFQGHALKLIRKELSPSKALIAFVGGSLTLYCYAVEGKHAGNLDSAHLGLSDGRWEGFNEKLMDMLVENMCMQAESGADTIAIFDTCGGEVTPEVFGEKIVPYLSIQMERFKSRHPSIPILYYSKKTGPAHWEKLTSLPISCLGIDWRHSLPEVIRDWSKHWAIQGNVDPDWLFLETDELKNDCLCFLKVCLNFQSI